MSFIPTGFGEIVVTYSQQGTIRPAQWTVGVEFGVTENFNTYLDGVIADWSAAGRVLDQQTYDNRLTAINVRMTRMSASGPVIYDRPLSLVGLRTGDAQPPNVAVLCRRTTDRGGRRGRGRLYLPSAYLSEVDVQEGGIIAGARRVQLQTLASNIRQGLTSVAGSRAVLLHNDGVVPPDPLNTIEVQPMVATMRRRLRK